MNTNRHPGLDFRGCGGHTQAPDIKRLKCEAPSAVEDWEHFTKKLGHTSNPWELLKGKDSEYPKSQVQFDEGTGAENASLVKRMCLSMSAEFGLSNGNLIVP